MASVRFVRRVFWWSVLASFGCNGDGAVTSASGVDSATGSTTASDATSGGVDSMTTSSAGSSSGRAESSSTGSDASTSDSTSGSDGSSSGSSGIGEGSTSTSVGASSSSGSTGSGFVDCYEEGVHPYGGALCGPGVAPCEVAEEVVDPMPVFRNGAPAITHDSDCSPQVFFSRAQGGFSGMLAVHDDAGSWTLHPAPEPTAQPGVAYDAIAGNTQVVMYDGAFGVHLATWDGGFVDGEDLPGAHSLRTQGVASLGDGVLQLGVSTQAGSGVAHAEYDGASWTTTPIATNAEWVGAGIGAGGEPQITYWGSGGGTWELFWHDALAETTELVVPYGSNTLDVGDHRIAVVGDAPRIVASRRQPNGLHEVVLATRTAPNDWAVDVLVSEDSTGEETCMTAPSFEGQTCDYDFIRYRPLDLVASQGGDVRVYFAEDHNIGTLVAECLAMPFPVCFWAPQSDVSEFTVLLAAPDGAGGFDTAPLIIGGRVVAMEHSLDAGGTTHVAAYIDEDEGSTVSYFRVE